MTTMAMMMKVMTMISYNNPNMLEHWNPFWKEELPKPTLLILNTVRRSVIYILINVLLKVPEMVNRMTGVDVTNVRTIHEKYL